MHKVQCCYFVIVTHSTCLCHLMRDVPPEELNAAALLYDLQTRSTFTKLLNLDDIMSTSWAQVTLPVRYGGFGLTSALQLSPKAFLASWVHSLKSGNKERSLASDMQRSLQPGQVLTALISDTKKLQHKLTDKEFKQQTQDMPLQKMLHV